MRPIRNYLFDFDGTVIDSIGLILESYRHTLRVHRGTTPPDELFLASVGRPLFVQFEEIADSAEERDAMIETYRRHSIDNHDRMVRAFDGMNELLGWLRARGRKLGIVSSKRRLGVDRGLRRLALEGVFEVVVSSDDVERPKPHPEPVHKALDALGADPSETVFIGDSAHDLTAGRAAGIRTGAALWGPFDRAQLSPCAPDYWLDAPRSVRDLEQP